MLLEKNANIYRMENVMKSRTTQHQSHSDQTTAEQPVQQRAYELYMKRGQEPGHELEDWLQAERDVRQSQEHQRISSPTQH
jgi:hypothetical protein